MGQGGREAIDGLTVNVKRLWGPLSGEEGLIKRGRHNEAVRAHFFWKSVNRVYVASLNGNAEKGFLAGNIDKYERRYEGEKPGRGEPLSLFFLIVRDFFSWP